MRCPKGMLLNLFIFSLFNLLTAATVPQNSPDKYYFSRPNLQSNIVGRIIGAPVEYSVMRSEDIAWLTEAYMERAALQERSWLGLSPEQYLRPEFGVWPLSDTNRFARWTAASLTTNGVTTTNIIVGYNYVTNLGAGIDTARIGTYPSGQSGWLNPYNLLNPQNDPAGYLSTNDAELVDAPTVTKGGTIRSPRHFDMARITNTWITSAWTNITSNAVSVITMAMTNGTVSAYTNNWYGTRPDELYEVVHTNITSMTPVDAIFRAGHAVGHAASVPTEKPWLFGTYRAAVITNVYAAMAGMKRLAEDAIFIAPDIGEQWICRWNWYDGQLAPGPITNTPSLWEGLPYYFHAHSQEYDIYDDGQNYQESYPSGDSQFYNTNSYIFASSWTTNVVMAGGIDRLSMARMWVVADVERNIIAWGDTASGYENYTTNVKATVALPLGNVTRAADLYGLNRYQFVVTNDLHATCEAAITAAGLTVRSPGYQPPLHFPLMPASEDTPRHYTSSEISETTEVHLQPVLVLDFEPWTKMPIGGTQ